MVHFDRTLSRHEAVSADGTPYTLVNERIAVSLTGVPGWGGGLAAAYDHPRAVIRRGQVTPIIDPVMIVRLVGLLALALAALIGTVRR